MNACLTVSMEAKDDHVSTYYRGTKAMNDEWDLSMLSFFHPIVAVMPTTVTRTMCFPEWPDCPGEEWKKS